jgi:Cyclic nucleotide-binding domain/Major Facilitator Superfamily
LRKGRSRTVRDVLQLPDVRRLELGWGASVVGELAGQVTLVVYSFDKGGAALVAAYVASRTLLSMVVTLGIAGVSGSTRTGVLLRRITGLRTVLLALAALTAALHWAPVVVIAFAAASSSLAGTYRPLQVAIFPWLVRTPVELTSANAVAAVLENSGALAGPLLAGGLLIFAAPPLPMALAAGFVGLATLSLRGLVVPERPRSAAKGVVQVARDAAGGLTELARVAPPGGVAILAFAQTFVRGALVVLIAVLAVKTLALGQSAVGWLTAAIGAGGLVGGVAAATLVHITRLGRTFVAALPLWGLPLVWLALTPSAAVAYLALVVVGVGNAIEDVAAFTLVARCAGAHSAGRLLGAIEFVCQAGLGVGAVAAPLPLAVIELLATDLKPHEFAPGTAAVREGETGDLFYLIVAGSATVSIGGKPGPSLSVGDCFGEIALLSNVPRVATVMADQPLRTLALERDAFLVAIASNSISSAAADALVDQRLIENTPADP